SIVDNNFGTIPKVNNRPPRLSAKSTNVIVKNIYSMPQRVKNSSTYSTPLFEAKPVNNTAKYPGKEMKQWKKDKIIELIAQAADASKGGAFVNEKYNKTTIGIIALYQLTRPVSNNPC